ncbi:hypothetical protein H0H81_011402 [Sphagnurus paluster]|uniref:BTB domain-containing protein n=1 Tax=Sphagnurus paluster TaxID=117069 RepID=A0A9P7K3H9_9AGAR|nr:hypothetical protein H0H81_011402 [Sphagnurus paluster]
MAEITKVESEDQPPAISTQFCATDADVIFQSKDGFRFLIHRRNLETPFPPSEFETQGEVVNLSEDSNTLELLFQFIYPKRLPDMDKINYATVALLAEAADKYEVFSAMYVCNTRLRYVLGHVHCQCQIIYV